MQHPLAPLALVLAAAATAQNQGLVLTNGSVDYVDVPTTSTLVPSGGVTVEAWVTYDGSTLGSGWRFPTLLRKDPSPNQASYFLRVEAGQTRTNRLLWWVSTATGNYSVGWTFAAGALQTWTHVAATYDGAALRLVVNGTQVAQTNGNGAILDRGGEFRIGGGDLTVQGGETWNGEIDEVRVWPFARSPAAIQSTMNLALAGVPGEVSTWNLDGHVLDTSNGNHGTAVGAPAFANNSLALQPLSPGASNFGTGSGCRATGLAAIAAMPQLANAAFGFVGTRAPANQAGLALLSVGRLPAPLPIAGIDVWVDLAFGVTVFLQSSSIGTAEVVFPVPAQGQFLGQAVFGQFAWIDPSCASGVSASNAVAVSILP